MAVRKNKIWTSEVPVKGIINRMLHLSSARKWESKIKAQD